MKHVASQEAAIKGNTEAVIAQFGPVSDLDDFGLNGDSVQYVEGYIERIRTSITPELTEQLTMIFGSFLGECVIACYGGRWSWDDSNPSVHINDRLAFYPFAKVSKQFANGADAGGDGIGGAFDMLGVLKDTDISLL